MDYLNKKLEQDEKEAWKHVKYGGIGRVLWGIVLVVSLFLVLIGGSGIAIGIFSFFMLGAAQSNYDKGKKLQTLIRNFRLYTEKLHGKGKVTVDELSEYVCQPSKVVLDNLNEMIRIGYIFKVEDGSDYCRYAYIQDAAIQLPSMEKRVMVSVTCAACGGITQIPKGQTGVCSYCDSEIKA